METFDDALAMIENTADRLVILLGAPDLAHDLLEAHAILRGSESYIQLSFLNSDGQMREDY